MAEELNTVGYKLKRARLDKKLALKDVYRKTRIHIDTLKSIETDKLKDINPTYVRGFLRIYAQYLGLDSQEIVEQYQAGISSEDSTDDIIVKKDGVPKANVKININIFKSKKIQKILKLFVIICIIVFLGRMILVLKNKKAASTDTKPEVVQEQLLSPIKKADFFKLAIRAKEDCWVQVKCDGKKIYEGILKKGMREDWNAKDKINFSLGNAGGVEIEVNDEILSSLGRKGQVLKNISITRDGISLVDNR